MRSFLNRGGRHALVWRVGAALSLLAVIMLTFGCQREQREDEAPTENGVAEPAESQDQMEQTGQEQRADQKTLQLGPYTFGTFADFDSDGDMRLDEQEIADGLRDQNVFARWDENGDQMLETQEFAAYLFDVTDADQNMRIDGDEYRQLTSNWSRFEQRAEQFEAWDEDGTEWINRPEFVNRFEQMEVFEEVDINANGSLELDEIGGELVTIWDENDDNVVDINEFGFEPIEPGVSRR